MKQLNSVMMREVVKRRNKRGKPMNEKSKEAEKQNDKPKDASNYFHRHGALHQFENNQNEVF